MHYLIESAQQDCEVGTIILRKLRLPKVKKMNKADKWQNQGLNLFCLALKLVLLMTMWKYSLLSNQRRLSFFFQF